MKSETITQRDDLMIRRHGLEPGEALPRHTDLCHRPEPQPEAGGLA